MAENYRIKCNKYRKFKSPEISYSFSKILALFFNKTLFIVINMAGMTQKYVKKNQLRY